MNEKQLLKQLQQHFKTIREKANTMLGRPDIDMPEVRAFLFEIATSCIYETNELEKQPVKVFLSGPISSRMSTYKSEFAAWENLIACTGYIPINPATLPLGLEQADYMRITIAMLQRADAIMMLPGWEESAGAKLEKAYAEYTGIRVMYPVDFLAFTTTCMNERRGPKDDGDQ